MSIKVFGCKVVYFAGGVVFHRGGSVTNMATLYSFKRTSCEKRIKKKSQVPGIYLEPNKLKMGE